MNQTELSLAHIQPENCRYDSFQYQINRKLVSSSVPLLLRAKHVQKRVKPL